MIGDLRVRQCLADLWGLAAATVEVHNGGMNSATWFVTDHGERWVAKAVAPSSHRSFSGGLAVASALEAAGIPAGAPVATRHGDLVADVDGIPLALLTWVPGEAVPDQRLIGTTLARVHRALRDVPVPDPELFHWVDPDAGHLDVRPWVRPAVAAAVAAYDRLGPETLSWGLLHTDPSPEAFRAEPQEAFRAGSREALRTESPEALRAGPPEALRRRETCGVIDWSTAMRGPLLYDVASAVMYVGGPHHAGALVDAYLAEGVLPRAEADRALPVMVRFRWAVQADYFARRIAHHDMTGISDPAENERGLADAHDALAPLSER
ncbi:phosphotransferase enzyme family protein [Catenuloplanes japonicus]|uniref:phosphotransferase enzyme family protein n=1 Tax=Catenuloplanes japonicus TaxID=33876 RepID=UPI00068AFD15|nr:phosphotransferase [Catenuloplanes japonicus]